MESRRLSELKATNPYLRLGTDVSDLEKSIKTLGLIAPIVITEDNLILAGARRYQALLNLGFTEAPVKVVSGNALEKELVSIDENLVRKDLTKIEIESQLRRAKEIYQELFPVEEVPESEIESEEKNEKTVLPAEKFLTMVAEKTGLSPKQIHEAIERDEKASVEVKEARKNGELSLSQTNQIVKLNKEDQKVAIDHLKELPTRELKKFIKIAKTKGVDEAIAATPQLPNQRDFEELNQNLKKIIKKLKQLELEGIFSNDLPEETQSLIQDLVEGIDTNKFHSTSSTSSSESYLS